MSKFVDATYTVPSKAPEIGLGVMRDVTDKPKLRAKMMKELREADAKKPNQPWARLWYEGKDPKQIAAQRELEPYDPLGPPKVDGFRRETVFESLLGLGAVAAAGYLIYKFLKPRLARASSTGSGQSAGGGSGSSW